MRVFCFSAMHFSYVNRVLQQSLPFSVVSLLSLYQYQSRGIVLTEWAAALAKFFISSHKMATWRIPVLVTYVCAFRRATCPKSTLRCSKESGHTPRWLSMFHFYSAEDTVGVHLRYKPASHIPTPFLLGTWQMMPKKQKNSVNLISLAQDM